MLTGLTSLIAGFVSGETVAMVGRVRRAVLIYGLAAVCGLAGIGFLIGAAFVTLAERVGTVQAALWFGGGFIFIAIVLPLVFGSIARARARQTAQRRKTDAKAIAGAAAIAAVPSLLSGKARMGGLLVPLMAVAAYAIYRESRRMPSSDDRL